MPRYKELKYEGKTYSKPFEINDILIENKMNWMLDAEINNSRLEINKDTLIWNAGVWYNGIWEYGVFRAGEWRMGVWKNGVFYNGLWKNGIFEDGIIFNGRFIKGQIAGGEIKGGEFISMNIIENIKVSDKAKIYKDDSIKKYTDFSK